MKLLADVNKRGIEFLCRRILKIVNKEREFLFENPAHLAWIMFHWQNLFYAGRIAYGYEGRIKKGYQNENNPKYELENIFEDDEDYHNLVYDAWCCSTDILDDNQWGRIFPEELISYRPDDSNMNRLLNKTNKTMGEWVDICTDDNYRYKSIYPEFKSVYNHFLACFGTGVGWNKDGYIARTGPADIDFDTYNGWLDLDIDNFPKSIKEVFGQIIFSDKARSCIQVNKDLLSKYQAEKKEKEKNSTFSISMRMMITMSQTSLRKQNISFTDYTDEEIDQMNERELDKYYIYIVNLNLNSVGIKLNSKLIGIGKGELVNENNDFEVELKKPFSWYPFSSGYSPMMMIPDNAHESYIKAAYYIASDVLKNKDFFNKEKYKSGIVKEAKKWFRTYQPKFPHIITDMP